MKRLVLAVVVVAGCGGTPPVAPSSGTGTGSGAAPGARPTGTACDAARAKVEQLYRASAAGKEPARADELVADNTAMVMNDCVTAPDKLAACIAAATSAADLEARCLIPIDDEGSEGDQRAR
jgi:hypothetical protein